jgi:hypothetical protein
LIISTGKIEERDQMSKDETEYTDDFAAGLELMWGQGFMSPGGPEEAGLIVQGLNLQGKEILDIGSGLGGPSICLVSQHGAGRVVGIGAKFHREPFCYNSFGMPEGLIWEFLV